MTAMRGRLDRLEQSNTPKVWGRFITVRAGRCDDDQARVYLAGQGITLGAHDLLFVETHRDPGDSAAIAPDAPLGHEIIECTDRFEDMLARLDC